MAKLGLWFLAITAFLATLYPLTDGDIWWHLASGRLMWENSAFLRQDPFLGMQQPWINVHWLYQIVAYGIFSFGNLLAGNNGGAWALVMGHSFLWALAAWVWGGALAKGSKPYSKISNPTMSYFVIILLLCIVLFWIMRWNLLARPLAPSILLLGLQWRWSQRGRAWWPAIIIAQVILANLQGLFLLGPLLVLSCTKNWRLALIMAGASALHPHGLHNLLYPFPLLMRIMPGNLFSTGIAENVPVFPLLRQGSIDAWALLGITICLFSCLAFHIFKFSFKMKKMGDALFSPSWGPLLIFLPLAWMARRNLPLLLYGLLPLLNTIPLAFSRWRLPVSTLWLALMLQFFAVFQWWQVYKYPVAPFRFSTAVLPILEKKCAQTSAPIEIFNAVEQGGWWNWHLDSCMQVFIDGRLILQSAPFYRRYLEVLENPPGINELQKEYNFALVVLPRRYPTAYAKLSQYLMENPQNWNLVYADSAIALWYPAQEFGGWQPGSEQTPAANLAAPSKQATGELPRR